VSFWQVESEKRKESGQMGEKTYGIDFFAGFIVGALVGAAAALLFAPQSGEETRTLIQEKGVELKGRADELQLQAKEKAQSLSSQAKEKAGDVQSRVKEAIEEGKTAAAKKKEELLSQIKQEPASGEEPAVV
jgi:gas vesicle protein